MNSHKDIKYKAIIDTNLLLDLYKKRDYISPFTRGTLERFLEKGREFCLIIAGSRMKNELTGSKYEKNIEDNLDLLKMLVYYNDEPSSINVKVYDDEINCEIDKKIINFTNSKFWDGNKELNPNLVESKIKGDPHLLYILNHFGIDILLSRDYDLLCRCEENEFKRYFPNFNKVLFFLKKDQWDDKNLDIINEIENAFNFKFSIE